MLIDCFISAFLTCLFLTLQVDAEGSKLQEKLDTFCRERLPTLNKNCEDRPYARLDGNDWRCFKAVKSDQSSLACVDNNGGLVRCSKPDLAGKKYCTKDSNLRGIIDSAATSSLQVILDNYCLNQVSVIHKNCKKVQFARLDGKTWRCFDWVDTDADLTTACVDDRGTAVACMPGFTGEWAGKGGYYCSMDEDIRNLKDKLVLKECRKEETPVEEIEGPTLQSKLDDYCEKENCNGNFFARFGLDKEEATAMWRCYQSVDQTKMSESCIADRPHTARDLKNCGGEPVSEGGNYCTKNKDIKSIINQELVQSPCEYNICASQEGCPLKKGSLLTTLPYFNQDFFISFEFKITEYQSGYQSLLHFADQYNSDSDTQQFGSRIPGVWIKNSGQVYVCFAISGNGNKCQPKETKEYAKDKWHSVQIYQGLKDCKVVFTVVVDGLIVMEEYNTSPKTFNNVKVYGADPWYKNIKGSIKNLIINKDTSKICTVSGPVECRTKKGFKCILPVKYKGSVYSGCTTAGDHKDPWCYQQEGGWDYCNPDCPVDKQGFKKPTLQEELDSYCKNDLSNSIGKCSTQTYETKPAQQENTIGVYGQPDNSYAVYNQQGNSYGSYGQQGGYSNGGYGQNIQTQTLVEKDFPLTEMGAARFWSNFWTCFETKTLRTWYKLKQCIDNDEKMVDCSAGEPQSFENVYCGTGTKKEPYLSATDADLKAIIKAYNTPLSLETKKENCKRKLLPKSEDTGIASMSSEYSDKYSAAKCIDGDLDTYCYNKKGGDENPFFMIEYKEPKKVYQVTLTIKPGYEKYAKDIQVFVTDDPSVSSSGLLPDAIAASSGTQIGSRFEGPPTKGQVIDFISKTGVEGKYVIVKQGKGTMTFTEVKVNSDPANLPDMDGGWSDFGACSLPCGGGVKKRTCSNPKPSGKGAPCVGKEAESCNTRECMGSCGWNLCSTPTGCLLSQSLVLTTIPKINMEFAISFEFQAKQYKDDWQSLLHFTQNGDNDKDGDRIPGVWINEKGQIKFSFSLSGDKDRSMTTTQEYSLMSWHSVQISQAWVDCKYMFSISVDGVNVMEEENTQPTVFKNVKVYGGDPWSKVLEGSVRNLRINTETSYFCTVLENGEKSGSSAKTGSTTENEVQILGGTPNDSGPAILYKYTSSYDLIWKDQGPDNEYGSIWRPKNYQSEYCLIGDVAITGSDIPQQMALVIAAKKTGVLVHPTSFTKIWTNQANNAIYQMNAPAGYTCLGGLGWRSNTLLPEKKRFCCVKDEYLVEGENELLFQRTGVRQRLSLYTVIRGEDQYGMEGSNFNPVLGFGKPSTGYLLKGDEENVKNVWDLNEGETVQKPLKLYEISDLKQIWNSTGGLSNSDLAIWRSESKDQYSSIGDVAIDNLRKPSIGYLVKVSDPQNYNALKPPVSYSKVWDNKGSGSSQPLTIWRVTCKPGFIALGNVATAGKRPKIGEIMCVNQKYTEKGSDNGDSWKLIYQDAAAKKDVSIFEALESKPTQQTTRTFKAVPNYHEFPGSAYLLAQSAIDYTAEKPIVQVFMNNVQFLLDQEEKLPAKPVSLKKTSIENYSSIAQKVTKTISYAKSSSSSFSSKMGLEVGVKMTATYGVPAVSSVSAQLSTKVSMSMTTGETKKTTETDKTAVSVTVPACSKMYATISGNEYTSNIPYEATIRKIYYDGDEATGKQTGIYTGVGVSEVTVKYGKTISLPPSTCSAQPQPAPQPAPQQTSPTMTQGASGNAAPISGVMMASSNHDIIEKYYEEKIEETEKSMKLLDKQLYEEDIKIAIYKHKAEDLGVEIPDVEEILEKST